MYSQLLRIPGLVSMIVWGSILATIAILVGTGAYVYRSAQGWKETQEHSTKFILTTEILAYCFCGLGAISFLVTLFLRKAIMLAIACSKQGARAVGAMPLIIFLPIVQTAGLCVFVCI